MFFRRVKILTVTKYLRLLFILNTIRFFVAPLVMQPRTLYKRPKEFPLGNIIQISEVTWRQAAKQHSNRIRYLLQPGLTPTTAQINSGRKQKNMNINDQAVRWSSLDPKNPVYNFLIEYYGIKGAKGPSRLARWSPDPSLLQINYMKEKEKLLMSGVMQMKPKKDLLNSDNDVFEAVMQTSKGLGGVFLENASYDDIGGLLHLRGAMPVVTRTGKCSGVLYSPGLFFNRNVSSESPEQRLKMMKTIAPFQWYSSVLRTTLNSEPILHCYGLHEWAMQYHPPGSPPPPSAKYQSSLPLRVSRETINSTVERRGVSCTHVDALRFFAQPAKALNQYGADLRRNDQLRLEQKGCVHAHMDLLKIVLKLVPFVSSTLVGDVLELALMSRKLDIEASPYNARTYGLGIVPVETIKGRKQYKKRQTELLHKAEPIRTQLLNAYDLFVSLSFDEQLLHDTAIPTSIFFKKERN